MGWLRRFFTRQKRQERDTAFWIHVRCRRCGEAIRVRADRRYDVASEWCDTGESGPAYTMHKDIVGARCFQRISVDLTFDHRLQIRERRIAGGEFLSEAEYAAALAEQSPRGSPPSPFSPGAPGKAE
jgi:hypothetical protein